MAKLFLVPTPIGNLEDITLRAMRILKEVDVILAEDTRSAKNLLKHFGMAEKKIFSHHRDNEHHSAPESVKMIQSGMNLALITESGTPAISDPGFLLARECIRNNIPVEVLPGPAAFIPALVLSGLSCERFCFEGFLPQKKGRQKKLEELKFESRTMVFYESPHRLLKTLKQFMETFGEKRKGSVSRELTKVYEETVRGSLEEIFQYFNSKEVKGEFVIVVEGSGKNYEGLQKGNASNR